MTNKIIKKTIAVLAISFLLIAQLTGCGMGSKEPLTGVTKVSFLGTGGDVDSATVCILTNDLRVKVYDVWSYSDSDFDFYSGEIPGDEYLEEEYTVSEEAWDKLMKALGQNDFMSMPDKLPKVEAYDGSSKYILVETSAGSHLSGGYEAGNGRGRAHKRYAKVQKAFFEAISEND